MSTTTSNRHRTAALALLCAGALAACGSPAAAPAASTTTTATGTASTGAAAAVDPGADGALADLARRRGAQAVSTTPATPDHPGLAVLAATTGGTSTTVTLLAREGAGWRTESELTAGAPLLADREGGAVEWRWLTGGFAPDAVVSLRGGTLSGGVDAVIARREDDGRWRFVPLEGQHEGVATADDVYAANPLFDDSSTFVTREQAGGQVVVTYWDYAVGADVAWFTKSPGPRSQG
ncbi:hypothetical protein GTQ99_17385 [Kineococcus sp. T13]|uniref:hypothetical protein n=1 Tax=Kineococcus vitellinus TaxID=2696565 RepID=UPI001412E50C|nr:hypothetical protein [Kineococcus vitellinus]NAZ77182.1 hypothetical protein [Kineococcus vitellinus]